MTAVASGPPVELGRYVLGDRLGRGGSGVVHEAWDPVLSRKVAIKLLRAEGDTDASGDARLLREARALARVRHPNVIEIYDVGVYDRDGSDRAVDGVYLVMELVAGTDGHRWLRERDRSVDEILAVFLAAGRGLAAAHAANVLHRDFKPANLLVADDGRVRVLDFGLARAAGEDGSSDGSTPQPASTPRHVSGDSWSGPQVTCDGFVIGTPPFMAPEQHFAEPVDIRTDVYNFCASLWYALAATPPFAGRTIGELGARKRLGPPTVPADARDPLRSILTVLARGLAPHPDDRFANMDQLVRALAHAGSPSRRRIVAVAAVPVLAVLGGAMLIGRDSAPACDEGLDEVAGSWTDTTRARVREALGSDAGQAAVASLDGWAASWAQQRIDACSAADPVLRDAKLACLRRAQRSLDATTELLATADVEVARRAFRLVAELPQPSECGGQDLSEPQDAASEQVREHIVAARTLAAAGRTTDAEQQLASADAVVATVASPSLRVELEYTRGLVLDDVADFEGAAAALERAYLLAVDTGLDAAATDAAIELVLLHGTHDPDPIADTWVRRAEAALARLGGDAAREATLHRHVAGLHAARGEYADALARLERAATVAPSPTPLETATLREMTGTVLAELGELDRAAVELEAAIAALHDIVGQEHPTLVSTWAELGHVRRKQGRREDALTHYERALAIAEGMGEPDHPDLALAHNSLAIVLDELGRYRDALPHYELALRVIEAHHGADHPWAGAAHQNLGINLAALGRHDAAFEHFARARAIWEPTLGPEHREVGKTWLSEGEAYAAIGDVSRAIIDFRRALAIFEAGLGSDHPELVPVLVHLALALERAGDPDEARTAIERGFQIASTRLGDEHPMTGRALAVRGLLDTHRTRAREDGERAAALLGTMPEESTAHGLALLVIARTTDDRASARRSATQAALLLRKAGSSAAVWAEEAAALRDAS